jgi:hypothetical protein
MGDLFPPVFWDPFFAIKGPSQLPINSFRGVGIVPEVDGQKAYFLE